MNLKFLTGKKEKEFGIKYHAKQQRMITNSLKRAEEKLRETSIRDLSFSDCVDDVKEYKRRLIHHTDELAKLK